MTQSRHGFGRAHGRRSRANLAHDGGHESPKGRQSVEAPDGQCWGCWQNRCEPWEHDTWCPQWYVKTSEFSGC